MRKISLIGLIVILTAATVNSQDISRIFLKSIDDSTVVMRFGRYRIELREGSDSLRISAGGIYWNAAKVLNAALLDSIHDGLGRFSGDTVPFSYHSPIPTIFEIYIDSAISTNADDSVTFEGTRDDMGVHPDVYFNAAGWPTKHYNGDTLIYSHRFWMVQTPTIGGNYSTEEPTLYYSDDSGTAWYIPYKVDTLGGNTLWVDTPLCPYISPYYNSDPDIIVAEDGKMYVYWRHHYNVSFPDPDTVQVLVKSSSNGIDWSDSTLLWWDTGDVGGQATCMSPSVIYDDDGYYRLWAVWVTASDTIVAMLEASTPIGLGHNGDTLYEDDSVHCSFTGVPAGEKPWHINVTKVHGLYTMALTLKKNDEAFGYRNYLAISIDGINWQVSDTITDSTGSGWDGRMVYRGALVPHQIVERLYFDYWYTGENAGSWFIGKTTIEFPTTAAIADSADVAADAYTAHGDKDGDSIDVSAYEVQLNNEAGLYAVLSDVSDFVQPAEVSSDADSLVGIDIQAKTGNLQDDYILKVDITGADTSLLWEADAGRWVASNDTMFLVDTDGDTLAAFWDDDAGNVRWQVATEDQSLRMLIDSLIVTDILISETLSVGGMSVERNIVVTGTVDTVDVGALGATVPLITDDTTNFKTAYGWGNHSAQGYVNSLIELYAYFDRTYFDTLIDASGDSIICVYSDSTDLSIFDTDDLTQGASNKYDQALPDSSEWGIGYDSSQQLDAVRAEMDDSVTTTNVNAAGAVMESDFNATTFLYATTDNTPQPKTPSDVRSILNVEDGATADQTDAEIEAIIGPFIDTTTLDTIAVAHKAVEVDTADAVADAETKPVTGNAVYDFCETTKNYALNSELHTRSHTMTSTSDHTAGNYKLFHSNGSGEVVELAHGASNKVLTSGGASANPTWETPSTAWNWTDSAGHGKDSVIYSDTAKYAAASGGFTNAFIPGKLTVTGPIDHYGVMLELDTSMLYCSHADTFLRLPLDTIGIAGAEDTFQMLHPSILPIPEGKWGYRYWFAGTPPDAGIINEDVHILVSNDEVTWHEFFVGPESTTLSGRPIGYYDSTLHNPVFKAADFDSATYTSDPDITWDENGDLFVVFRVSRINVTDSPTVNYLYSASTSNGLDWTDTTLIIDGYWNSGSMISPKTSTLSLVSPGLIMRGAGDYLMYTTEDTSGSKYTRAAWEAPRIDTTWDNAAGFDSTIKFGSAPDSHRISIVHQTLPDGNMVWHADEIIYATDLIVNLVSSYSGTYYPHIYMGLSTDGEYFTTVSTPLLDTTNNQTAWDHNQLYRSSGYFVNLNGEMILRLYYSATDNDGDWYTGLTNVHFGKVLKKLEVLIWNPDLITDTVPAFGDVDSAMCPGGIQIHSLAIQTSVDGTYALKVMSFTAADPPVFHDWIDTLNVGASDQRASSREVDFEDDNSQMVDRGQSVYILTPSTDIDWIRVSVKYFIRDWE